MIFDTELSVALDAAKQAGKILLDYYKHPYKSWKKENKSMVTEADLAAEKVILEALKNNFSHPILSEETKDNLDRMNSPLAWMVDPLDGTQEFMQETGNFSILIGLAHEQNPVVGVVYKPLTDELYYAHQGSGAYKKIGEHIKKIEVSQYVTLENSSVLLSPIFIPQRKTEKIAQYMGVKNIGRVGSVGVKIASVAEGTYDFYFTLSTQMSEWDTCAPHCILSEAGGKLTDIYGNKFLYNQRNISRPKGLIASNGVMHEKIVEKIKEYNDRDKT